MSTPSGRAGSNQYFPHPPALPPSAPQHAPYSASYPPHHPPPPPSQHQQQPPSPYTAQSSYQHAPSTHTKPPEMVTLPPPHHVQQGIYSQPQYEPPYPQAQQPPPMGYPPQQPPPQGQQGQQGQQQVTFNQPAPRQRTAIACRYCRRRKIRCYGFDTNPDGRCQNCSRFNQECVFTPVSSQTHAFVPAHTAYPQLRGQQGRFPPAPQDPRAAYPQPGAGGPPIYGPQGQPLGAPAPPPPQQPHDNPHPHYPPPPSGPHQPYAQPTPYPTLPPAAPAYDSRGQPPAMDHRRGSSGMYDYPSAPSIPPISPSSQQPPSYGGQAYPPAGYYAQQSDQANPAHRRPSPPNNYSYDQGRTSASPHGSSAPPPAPMASYGTYPGGLHPPQVLPPATDPRNQSPAGQRRDEPRSGAMPVAGMLSDPSGGRSNTDNSMLSRLNMRAP